MSDKPDVEIVFELIPDDAIDDEERDRFGHGVFANWLLSALESANKPINIGLFGRWGTGKTGILKMLEKKLKSKHKKQYKYCYVDCWRISPDHIRHQLLIDLNDELCGLKRNELMRQLFYTTKKPDLVDSGKKFANSISELAKSLLMPSVFAMGILGILIGTDRIWPNIDMLSILGPIFLVPFITQLAVKLSNSNDRIIHTVTKVIPPVNSHEGFKDIFRMVISKQRKEKKDIVIALDNLDRCDGDVAVEILAIVKSFMEESHVFFIIPCDSAAIIKHLEEKRNFKDGMAEDFLRKFFQVYVTVPPLVSSLMIDYVDELVELYKIHADDEVKSVISIASMDNPRRIKQFLNNYIANYHLALEIEKKSLDDGTITHKCGFLAKILVLQDKFPKFYKELVNEENLLEYVEKYFEHDDIPDYDRDEIGKLIKPAELEDFLRLTRDIRVDNIRPFIKLAQDPHEKILEYAEIRDNMRTNKYEKVSKIIKSDKNKKMDKFIEIMESTINDDFKNGRAMFGTNDLNVILHVHEAIPDSHKSKVTELFAERVISENMLDKTIFDLDIVFKLIDEMKEKSQNAILKKYCSLFFTSNNYNDKLLRLLISRNQFFTNAIKDLFKERMVEFYNVQEDQAILAINKYFKNEYVEKLLDKKIIDTMLSRMTKDISRPSKDRINAYLRIKQLSNTQSKFEFIEKLLRIILEEQDQSKLNDKIDFVLEVLENLDHDDVTEDGMHLIYDIMTKYENELPNEDQKSRLFAPILKHFDKLSEDTKTAFINDKLQHCFSRSDDNLTRIFSAMNSSKETFLNYDKIFEAMFNVVSSYANPLVFEYLIKNTADDQRDKILDLIASHIKGQDESKRRQTCRVIEKVYEDFEEIDRIIPSIINALNNPNYSDRGEMLNLLSTVFVSCSSTQDGMLREFVKWTGDGTFGADAINYLDTKWSDFNHSQRLLVWNKTISSINNNFNNNTRLILDFLVDRKKITDNNFQNVVDVLINHIGQANEIVLEYMIKIRRMFTLDDDTVRIILDIPEDNDRIRELKEQFRNAKKDDNG